MGFLITVLSFILMVGCVSQQQWYFQDRHGNARVGSLTVGDSVRYVVQPNEKIIRDLVRCFYDKQNMHLVRMSMYKEGALSCVFLSAVPEGVADSVIFDYNSTYRTKFNYNHVKSICIVFDSLAHISAVEAYDGFTNKPMTEIINRCYDSVR